MRTSPVLDMRHPLVIDGSVPGEYERLLQAVKTARLSWWPRRADRQSPARRVRGGHRTKSLSFLVERVDSAEARSTLLSE
jgi:hypothetical protein